MIFGMGYSLSIILLTKIVCKDSSKKGIMNGILSIGTAFGASLYNLVGEFVFINSSGKGTTISEEFYEFEIANNYKKYIILEEFSIFASIAIVILFFKNNASVLVKDKENKEENECNILNLAENLEDKINQNNSLSEAGKEVKQEMINILKSSKEKSIKINELFEQAKHNISKSINRNYLNNFYQDDNNFESEEAASLDKERKERVEIYNRLNNLRQTYKDLLYRGPYSSNDINKI